MPPAPPSKVLVQNAGLVLLAPFLPTLLERAGLVSGQEFLSPEAQSRAPHLLEYACTGTAPGPETELALNKLLCGLPLDVSLSSDFEVSKEEKEMCAGLLSAVIAQWHTLGETSVASLRGTFLKRNGVLVAGDPNEQVVHLHVTKGPFDMLLDRLPWRYSVVHLPWMKDPLQVAWR